MEWLNEVVQNLKEVREDGMEELKRLIQEYDITLTDEKLCEALEKIEKGDVRGNVDFEEEGVEGVIEFLPHNCRPYLYAVITINIRIAGNYKEIKIYNIWEGKLNEISDFSGFSDLGLILAEKIAKTFGKKVGVLEEEDKKSLVIQNGNDLIKIEEVERDC